MDAKQAACLKCFKCCKEFSVVTAYEWDVEAVHFFETRGFKCNKLVLKNRNLIELSMPVTCPHLTETGCGIYETRPKGCRIYDGREQFGEDCLWTGLDLK